MDFSRAFTVKAPLTAVKTFHSRSGSMRSITPPPVFVQFHQAPETLQEGSEMVFTLWMGPLPVRWRARIENVTQHGFDDRQVEGPFTSWVHHHQFYQLDNGTTEIRDWVEAELKPNGFLRWLGVFMWLNMPLLFAFRGWKTRRLVQAARS